MTDHSKAPDWYGEPPKGGIPVDRWGYTHVEWFLVNAKRYLDELASAKVTA